MSPMKVAIIGGSGKMGKWFTGFLLKDGKEVVIHARNKQRLMETGRQFGVTATTDIGQAVEGADIVLLSVPIDVFEDVILQLKSCLGAEQIIFDVTSVKVKPVEIMQRHLPDFNILGTHPVFGPGAKSVRNQNFVLTPTNDSERALSEKVVRYLGERGAAVTVMTPEEHDEMMAVILGLAHFIAIAAADVLLSFDQLERMKKIGGPTYRVLLTLAESVITEDPELYASIQMNLPHMPEMELLFQRSSAVWAEIVRNKDRHAFIDRMNVLKDRLENIDPEFGKSYQDMYRLADEKKTP